MGYFIKHWVAKENNTTTIDFNKVYEEEFSKLMPSKKNVETLDSSVMVIDGQGTRFSLGV